MGQAGSRNVPSCIFGSKANKTKHGKNQKARRKDIKDGAGDSNSKSQLKQEHNTNNLNKNTVEGDTVRPQEITRQGLIEKLKVLKITAEIDKRFTILDESTDNVLKYRTPHFRAVAQVYTPALAEKESIQVGWIQVCRDMVFVNTYGKEGITSWEFPELVSNKCNMVSDSDGKHYPWYGNRHEMKTVSGPCKAQQVSIFMNDNFFPQVTWYIPDTKFDKKPRLTHVYRKQRFYTFLVAKNPNTGDHFVLRTISWMMEIDILVHPEKPLGQRATLLSTFEQQQPEVLKRNIPISPSAMKAPNANHCQVLVWRPNKGHPTTVVPPVETTVNMQQYIESTRDYNKKLQQLLNEP